MHSQNVEQIFAGELPVFFVTVQQVHEGHEVVLIDVRKNEESLVTLNQQFGQERTARCQNRAMEGHKSVSLTSAVDMQV
jgi:hypothetical protein